MYEKLRFNLRKYMYISGAGGTGARGAVPIQILADQLTLCQIMTTKLVLVPLSGFLNLPPALIMHIA